MPAEPAPTGSSSSEDRAHGAAIWSRRSLRAVLASAAPLGAAHLGLLLVFDLAHHPVLTLILLASASLALVWAARRLEALPRILHSGPAILLGACLLRLLLLPLPVTLSDDALRYLWDGKVARAGRNPYALPPESPELAPLRSDATGVWSSQLPPHADVPTVYPPLAVTAFSISTLLPFPLLAWKALATAADLGACALLLALAGRRGVHPGRTAWYAWNPLVVLEVAGMGHVDALGVAAVLGAVLCLTPRPGSGRISPVEGAVLAAAGVLARLAPLALLPMWSRQSRRPAAFLGVSLGLAGIAFLPVWTATGGIPPGLIRSGVSWELNGPLYEPLWRLLDGVGAAPAAARALGWIETRTGIFYGLDFLHPDLDPRLLAQGILALGMLAAVAASFRESDPLEGSGRLLGRLLLLSPTVSPWYLLWVLPWAALTRRAPWLLLAALIPLSYLPQTMNLPLIPWIYCAIWLPFAAAVLLSSLPLSRGGRKGGRERGPGGEGLGGVA